MNYPTKQSYPNSILWQVDQARILNTYGPNLIKCIGGRTVAQNYQCPHCESEDPSTKCGQPLKDK